MEITERLYVKNRQEWRKWLVKNHKNKKEIWLIYYKKSSKKERIPYIDALKEALCFGWIDGIVKSIDENIYVQRFTPRRKNSLWSLRNVKFYKELSKEKLITEAGKKAFGDKLGTHSPSLGKNAVEWHLKNKLGSNVPLEKRIKWHKEHKKICGCRPVQKNLMGYIK